MKPITGTHVYSYIKCPRAVALDLHRPRGDRRDLREEEQFLLQRGRDHEADFVAALDWPEPKFERGDFGAGAAETESWLRAGVEGVLQGVLLGSGRLGIPDLLRREPGDSDLGGHHYVVGDIKSSQRPRSDQVLQVAFYSALLAELQGRVPEYGYLVLGDGREQRFELRDFRPALREVVECIEQLRAAPTAARPFLSRACVSCHWSDLCRDELVERDDLSLLTGMTRGVRTTLEQAEIHSCRAVETLAVETVARATRLEPALLRRLQCAATARAAGAPVPERSRRAALGKGALVHLLFDSFDDRVLFMGALCDGQLQVELPASGPDEWLAFQRILTALPNRVPLLHYGATLPRWYEDRAFRRRSGIDVERRFVDVARQLRGAAVYPGPVFGLDDYIRHGLDRDPHRAGRASGAAWHARQPAGTEWLAAKGRSDLADLADLKRCWLDGVDGGMR